MDAVSLLPRSWAGPVSAAALGENWRTRGSAERFLRPTQARRYRAAMSWRVSAGLDEAGPPPRPAVLADWGGETFASGRGSRAPPTHSPDSARRDRTGLASRAAAFRSLLYASRSA